MGVVGGDAAGVAPSLVLRRQPQGKNNSPRYGPCHRLPPSRVRLKCASDPTRTAPIRCKGWGCPTCGRWMKDRFIAVASAQARLVFGRKCRFATLTLPPLARKELDQSEQWRVMAAALGKLQRRIERRPTHHARCTTKTLCRGCSRLQRCSEDNACDPCQDVGRRTPRCRNAGRHPVVPCRKKNVARYKDLSALWVRELHKDGVPHLHVLLDRFIPQAWLSKAWQECGGGAVVDIRQVKLDNIVAYVTKYLAKTLGEVRDPQQVARGDGLKGTRRYGAVGDISLKGVYPVAKGDQPWFLEFALTHRGKTVWWPPAHHDEVRAMLMDVMNSVGARPIEVMVVDWEAQGRARGVRQMAALQRRAEVQELMGANPEFSSQRAAELKAYWDARRAEGL